MGENGAYYSTVGVGGREGGWRHREGAMEMLRENGETLRDDSTPYVFLDLRIAFCAVSGSIAAYRENGHRYIDITGRVTVAKVK